MKPLKGKTILLLEDENLMRRKIANYLEEVGAEVTEAKNVGAAKDLLEHQKFDFALFDINLPDGTSIDLLKQNVVPEDTIIIVMTADPTMDTAIKALKLGAKDYLTKPMSPPEAFMAIKKCLKVQKAERIQQFTQSKRKRTAFIFGESLADFETQLVHLSKKEKDIQGALPPPVLIEGETGTGKSALAKWIHNNGPRSEKEFVQINCANLQDSIAESELFGHEKGAFTDAKNSRVGLFEAADGGTLFLDEIASLPEKVQAKILTILDDGLVRRVGGNKEIPVNVKIIAASNIDLHELVEAGKFRSDLFFRLDLIRAKLPPLRDRGNDILLIANSILGKLAPKYKLNKFELTPLSIEKINSYNWPGNIRELSFEIERALLFSDAHEIELLKNLNLDSMGAADAQTGSVAYNSQCPIPETGFNLEVYIFELINKTLEQCEGNVSKAARLLGVSRDYLRYKLKNNSGQSTQPSE
jgi:DNA-binding NtrC family response regulator